MDDSPNSDRRPKDIEIVRLARRDVLANLTMPPSSRFTRYQLAEHTDEFPDLTYRAGYHEYIVGGFWRQRTEIGAILELVGQDRRDALVGQLLRAYCDRGSDLLILDPREQQSNSALYSAHGFTIIDTIIQLEMSWPGRSRQQTHAVSIRAMEESDIGDVLEVEHHSFPWLWWNSEAELRWYAAVSGVELYVAESPTGNVIGYAGFTVMNRQAHLDRLAVHHTHQRQGYARALLAHTLALMAERGAQRVALTTQKDNLASQALYKSIGFRESGWQHDILGLYLRSS